MAITTINSGIQNALPVYRFAKGSLGTLVSSNYYTSVWARSGYPLAGTYNTTTAGGIALSGLVQGELDFVNAESGNSYLYNLSINATGNHGVGILADRLWHCGADSSGTILSVTAVTSQTINSVTWPSRDANNSTDGEGVFIALEISTTTGVATANANITLTYTNSTGTPNRTATLGRSWTSGLNAGVFIPFNLQNGDTGVRSVQSIQLSETLTSGAIQLVAFRPLAAIPVNNSYVRNDGYSLDAISGGFPILPNDCVLFLLYYATTTSGIATSGTYVITQG